MRRATQFILALILSFEVFLLWKNNQHLRHLREVYRLVEEADGYAREARQQARPLAPLVAPEVPAKAAPAGRGFSMSAPTRSLAERAVRNQITTRRSLKRQDPHYREAASAGEKLSLEVKYGPLLQDLNLSPDEELAMQELLRDRANLSEDINQSITAQNLNPDASLDLARKTIPAIREDHEREVSALLGPERYAKFKDYEQHLAPNLLIVEFQQVLGPDSGALSSSQVTALRDLLLNSQQPKGGGRPATLVVPIPEADLGTMREATFNFKTVGPGAVFVDQFGQVTSNHLLSEQDLRRAASILTPAQFKALEEVQKRQQARLKMGNSLHAI